MEDKIIIHIDGVQGSGKSYICSKIKNILCVDTDDIMKETKKKIESIQKKDFPKVIDRHTMKLIKQIEKNIVNNYIKNNNIIVFVGMTVKINKPTYKFFIKIDDFTAVYKRLMLRELDKIVTNYIKIKNYINKNNDPNEININNVSSQSIPFPFSYDDFLTEYKERLKQSKKKKYLAKTQEEIIQFIKKLII